MKNNRQSQKPEPTPESICNNILALTRRVQQYLPKSNSTSLVSGCLMTAQHLIMTEPLNFPDQPEQQDDDDGLDDLDDDDDHQAVQDHPPRDLRKEWSGNLPGSPRRPPPRPKPLKKKERNYKLDVNGVSGPDPNNIDIIHIPRGSKCHHCGDPVSVHPYDHNLPLENGHKAHVLCDQARAYMS